MEKILFLAHTESDGTLGRAALEALSSAVTLKQALAGSSLAAGFTGAATQPAADRIASCGATPFFAVTGPDFGISRYSTDAAAAEALCRASGATLVIAPATSRWARVLPGVAARLGGRAETHVTGLSAAADGLTAQRWYYRQRMEGNVRGVKRPWIILIDPGTQSAWEGAPGTAQIEQVALAAKDSEKRTATLGLRQPPADAQTIRPDAALLFVTGAGWTKKQADGQTHVPEAETLIRDFLKHTRASLGSTKSLVDLGGEGVQVLSFLSHLNQIGQTGSTPRHPKGLSTCCHGEEPHTVGWRFVNERRAISLDPNCGWARGKADVLYVADAFAVMREVNALLAAG